MKDYPKKVIESSRPTISPLLAIEHCLNALYNDKKHLTTDYISPTLTYEEIIGALLLARDEFELQEDCD